MVATSLASAARPFWRLLEHCDIDAEFVFRAAGLDPALMDKPRQRYPIERRNAAWVRAAQPTDDPCLGLKMAEVLAPTDLHALGYAVLASNTLRTALGRLSRYVHVINDGIGFALEDEGDGTRFTLITERSAHPSLLAPQEDSLWSWNPGLCRAACGQHLHRKLSADGATYSQIPETVRRTLAEQYLADPTKTLNEITFLLGFSEQAAFSRAFKRWTGRPPSAVRQLTC